MVAFLLKLPFVVLLCAQEGNHITIFDDGRDAQRQGNLSDAEFKELISSENEIGCGLDRCFTVSFEVLILAADLMLQHEVVLSALQCSQ